MPARTGWPCTSDHHLHYCDNCDTLSFGCCDCRNGDGVRRYCSGSTPGAFTANDQPYNRETQNCRCTREQFGWPHDLSNMQHVEDPVRQQLNAPRIHRQAPERRDADYYVTTGYQVRTTE